MSKIFVGLFSVLASSMVFAQATSPLYPQAVKPAVLQPLPQTIQPVQGAAPPATPLLTKPAVNTAIPSQEIRIANQKWSEISAMPDAAMLVLPDGRKMNAATAKMEAKKLQMASIKQAMLNPTSFASATKMTEVIRKRPAVTVNNSIALERGGSIAQAGSGFNAATGFQKDKMELVCKQDSNPGISKITGDFTQGGVLTIIGGCLQATAGELRVYGPFPTGYLSLKAFEWNESKVVVQIPQDLKGIPDGDLKVEVLTSDRKATKPRNIYFVARREIVDVSHMWHKTACVSVSEDEANAAGYGGRRICTNNSIDFLAWMDTGAGFGGVRNDQLYGSDGSWQVTINPSCVLISAWLDVARGSAPQINDWDLGPHNSSTVHARVKPAEWLDVHWYGDTAYRGSIFRLRANASCPVGISPNV
jgi:hypothetical protein